MSKGFRYWFDDMQKETSEPDALTIVFMAHFLGCNITLISGKGEEWSTDNNQAVDILLIYKGDNIYMPTDVGIYHLFSFKLCVYFNRFLFFSAMFKEFVQRK